jgi:hypothetical protein
MSNCRAILIACGALVWICSGAFCEDPLERKRLEAMEKFRLIFFETNPDEGFPESICQNLLQERAKRLKQFAEKEYKDLELFDFMVKDCTKGWGDCPECGRGKEHEHPQSSFSILTYEYFLTIREQRAYEWARVAFKEGVVGDDMRRVSPMSDFLAKWGTNEAFRTLEEGFRAAQQDLIASSLVWAAVTYGPESTTEGAFDYEKWLSIMEEFDSNRAAGKYRMPEKTAYGSPIRRVEHPFAGEIAKFKEHIAKQKEIGNKETESPKGISENTNGGGGTSAQQIDESKMSANQSGHLGTPQAQAQSRSTSTTDQEHARSEGETVSTWLCWACLGLLCAGLVIGVSSFLARFCRN